MRGRPPSPTLVAWRDLGRLDQKRCDVCLEVIDRVVDGFGKAIDPLIDLLGYQGTKSEQNGPPVQHGWLNGNSPSRA